MTTQPFDPRHGRIVQDAENTTGSFQAWSPVNSTTWQRRLLGVDARGIATILAGIVGMVLGLMAVILPLPELEGGMALLQALAAMAAGIAGIFTFGRVVLTLGNKVAEAFGFVTTSQAGWSITQRIDRAYQKMDRVATPEGLTAASELILQVARLAGREEELAFEMCKILGVKPYTFVDTNRKAFLSARSRAGRGRTDHLTSQSYTDFVSRALQGKERERFEVLEAERHALVCELARICIILEDISQAEVSAAEARKRASVASGLEEAQVEKEAFALQRLDTSAAEEHIRTLRQLDEAYQKVGSEYRLKA